MKILFAGDEHPYSAYALNEVIRLATNTWADVTLLAVAARRSRGQTRRGPYPGPGLTRLPGDFPGRRRRRGLTLCPGGAAV